MGNCLKPESQAMWGGEDWSAALMTDGGGYSQDTTCYSTSKIKEVKVRVSKKQLEKWLGKMDVQQKGLCVEQALAQLIKASVHCKTHHRSWKPMLQTIHEVY